MTPAEFGSLFKPIYDTTFTNLVDLPVESRPSHLAHYTSIGALEKIVSSNELWFSNPLFMNDHEEMLFGIREGMRILQEASAGSPFADLAGGVDNFDKIRQQYNALVGVFDQRVSFDIYVFCLSEYDIKNEPDGRLSMWRGYGANGNGVALVFNTSFCYPNRGVTVIVRQSSLWECGGTRAMDEGLI